MGDLEALSLQPNGFLLEDELLSPTSISPLLSNPSPESISGECWKKAEERTEEIIKQIQPTVVSEQKRKGVIEYVQGLLKSCLGCEAFPFGSVPLKTYLPDGDIDLTALCVQPAEDSLANDVRIVLEREVQRTDSDFEVKDVQYIHAEVKLIKCLVQNIVVDISFNQLGGLCTLCFLEKVDCLIGKDHLFKRSIILIKAWCYHESRILGAPHGLISTYALETMILYIFRLFHSSLDGPLAVLYRFLEYYSKFDWDNFCISLNGPVSISSLPQLVAETPDNDGGELLLDKEYLRWCVQLFSVPSRDLEAESRRFPDKHFNIIDPLKENNNLGRSVSKGNFYRIRSAFTFGARKLGQILLLTAEDIREELNKFFMNTLERHGSGKRPDVQVSAPYSNPTRNRILLNSPCVNYSSTSGDSRSCPEGLLEEEISNLHISGSHKNFSTRVGKEAQRCTTGVGSSLDVLERFGYIKEIDVSKGCLVGDTEDHVCPEMSSLPSQGIDGDMDRGDALVSTSGSVGIPNSLSDFSDDFDNHYNNLWFAKCNYGSFSRHLLSSPPPLCPVQHNHDFDTIDLALQLNRNVFTQMDVNGGCPIPHFYPVHPHIVSGSAFGVEDPTQANKHGIGTFFPDLVLSEMLYKERTNFSGRSSPRIPNSQSNRRFRESNYYGERESYMPPQEQYSSSQIRPRPIMSAGYFRDKHPSPRVSLQPNGSSVPSESSSPHSRGNSYDLSKVISPRPRPVSSVPIEGSKREAYHLEKETDFPPLSVPVAQSSK